MTTTDDTYEIEYDTCPDLDEWGYCDACGDRHENVMRINRALTDDERDAALLHGKLPKNIEWVPFELPPVYGVPDAEYWSQGTGRRPDGYRHPDGKTGHGHNATDTSPGNCPFCNGEPFDQLAAQVRADSIHVNVYCRALMPPEWDDRPMEDVPCAWCSDQEPGCACECHEERMYGYNEEDPSYACAKEGTYHTHDHRRIRPADCPFCTPTGTDGPTPAALVLAGRISVPVTCAADREPVMDPAGAFVYLRCSWCDDTAPECACQCHPFKGPTEAG